MLTSEENQRTCIINSESFGIIVQSVDNEIGPISAPICVCSLTLDHHLVTGNQYLLAIAGLCVLEDGGSGLGGGGCVGHGQSLEALDSVGTVVS